MNSKHTTESDAQLCCPCAGVGIRMRCWRRQQAVRSRGRSWLQSPGRRRRPSTSSPASLAHRPLSGPKILNLWRPTPSLRCVLLLPLSPPSSCSEVMGQSTAHRLLLQSTFICTMYCSSEAMCHTPFHTLDCCEITGAEVSWLSSAGQACHPLPASEHRRSRP